MNQILEHHAGVIKDLRKKMDNGKITLSEFEDRKAEQREKTMRRIRITYPDVHQFQIHKWMMDAEKGR